MKENVKTYYTMTFNLKHNLLKTKIDNFWSRMSIDG